VQGRGGVAEAMRVAAACFVLFAVAGFGPTRLLLPARLRRHEALWVLPVGAAFATLELAFLAYAFVPFLPALVVVLAGGVALGAFAWRRHPGALPRDVPGGAVSWRTLAVPLYLALLIGAIALVPMFRGGFVTVIGSGSDAHLAVGTAQFLQGHHPTDVAIGEPVDQVPLVWRSKPPIYLTYGAVSSLAGLEPYAVIAALSAALLALGALGFWLLAREMLGAGPWGAALAMGLVGLNRMVLHTGMHPYFNQTWGYVAMPFAILLAWWFVHHRSWRALILFAAFLGVLTFAYPLALPIPLLAAVVFWAVHRRERGLPIVPWHRLRDRRLLWFTPLIVLLAIPIGGVLEKIDTAKRVLLPGRSLENWGGDLTQFFPERFFLGVDDSGLAVLAFPLFAVGLWIALRRAPRDARWGLGAVLGFGLAAALYFRPRDFGFYFHFKALAYVGPIAVAIAAVGLSRLPRRWMAVAAAVVLVAGARTGAAHEVGQTFDQLPKSLLELKRVDAALPPGRSVRLDMTPDGRQLWAGSMLSGQPLCSQRPLTSTSYPHVPISRAADYVLVDEDLIKPVDAVGPPVMTLDRYVLYRLRPGLPGGDRCSQKMVQTVEKVR
jgi:hypothetical protein